MVLYALRVHKGIVHQHRHAEGNQQFPEPPGDDAETDEPHGFPAEFDAWRTLPQAVPQVRRSL